MSQITQALVQGVVFGSIYAIAALGFALVYNTTVIFHVAYGAIANIGVLVAMSLQANNDPVRLSLTLPLGVAVAISFGVLLYLAVYLPMQQRGSKTISIFVASLGASLIFSSLLQVVFGPALRYFNYTGFFEDHRVLGTSVSDLGATCVASGLIVMAAVVAAVRRTHWGQQVRAVSSNAESAQLAGVRTVAVTCGVFAISSGIAVIAGLLLGMQTSVSPPVDPTMTLLAAIAVLLAGRGAYISSYIAGLLIGVVQELAGALLPGQWATVTVFGAFVVVVLFRPRGLMAWRSA